MRKGIKRVLALVLAALSVSLGCVHMQVYGMEYLTFGAEQAIQQITYLGGLTPVMGTSEVTLGQLVNYYEANEHYPAYYAGTDAPNIYTFCKIYMEECAAEGVRAEVAFAQAMKETGFLRYKGDVSIQQLNFAGIGATGGGEPGNSFPSVRIGVRAQVQHLKAYATTDSLNQGVVDPRFAFVPRASAPYVEWLGKSENPSGIGWATAYRYGYSIVDDYMAKELQASRYSSWHNGVDYSLVYDPEYYMEHNPDVAAVCGGSSESLINHFLNYGMIEGRAANQRFHVKSYYNANQDLRIAFGRDLRSYYYHYMNYGVHEERTTVGVEALQNPVTRYHGIDYSSVYDFNYYIGRYPDIRDLYGNDDQSALAHFVTYGMAEGRLAKESFDVYAYRAKYPDLRQAFRNDLKSYYQHYISYGNGEKREATGRHELVAAMTVYSGVDYAPVYDYNYYIANNPDVNRAFSGDEEAVLAHFVTYGMREGRQACGSFNLNAYRSRYADLNAVFGDDRKAYFDHYMKYGIQEGREAN